MGTHAERMKALVGRDDLAPPIAKLIGFHVVDVGDGQAEFAMEAGPQHANPMGTVHGGILCDLADAAMGFAYASALDEGESFTTLELKINFLKPVWTGALTARAKIVKGGRTVGLVACEVLDAKGSLVAVASSTCMTLRGDMARGR